MTQFWRWLKNIFVPAIFTAESYEHQKETEAEYIGNKRSILIGMPRLRQLRVMKSKLYVVCDSFPGRQWNELVLSWANQENNITWSNRATGSIVDLEQKTHCLLMLRFASLEIKASSMPDDSLITAIRKT